MSTDYGSFSWPSSGGGGTSIPLFATFADFPLASSVPNTFALALDTDVLYFSNGTSWIVIGGAGLALSVGAFGSTPNADGLIITANVLSLTAADATNPGGVSTTTQSFLGQKTFVTGLTGTLTGSASLNVLTSALGNLTESTSDVLTISGGTGGVVGNVSIDVKKATTSQDGYLSSTDWNTFNSKQAAGNYITALTGDGTASGPGSAAFTLANVNSNIGTFASVTVNAKGLVTAAAALSGDATTSGSVLTLASVATAGTTGSSTAIPVVTINAKGLVTGISTAAVVAPAGTLSGTVLNSTVVSSSLTSVGTIGTGTWAGTTVATNHGGTGVTSVTTAPTASSFAGWDSALNLSANNLIEGYTTQATAATTTVLTVSSTYQQFFTGTTAGQILQLPVVSTLAVTGFGFLVTNNSTQTVTVNSSGGNLVLAQAANTTVLYTCILTTGTTAASWYAQVIGAGGAVTPTIQKFLSGSGTYTTPANVAYIRVRAVAGGGGGGGSGTGNGGTGGVGGTTTFGTSLVTLTGGGAGSTPGSGASGGSATINSPAFGTGLTGGSGGGGFNASSISSIYPSGGVGGNSPWGGGGSGSNLSAGGSGVANTGGGGGGSGYGSGVGNDWSGSGGGAGGYADVIITNPSSSYSYSVGSGGTAGAAGTNGTPGGTGGSGYIEVTEYYNNGAIGTATTITGSLTAANIASQGVQKTSTFTTAANSSTSTIYSYVVIGGGGGGGGATSVTGSGGGGGGGCSWGTFSGVAAGATVTIVTGSGGAGGGSGSSGTGGGASSITATGITTITANGGGGGGQSGSPSGGSQGTASGGVNNINGGSGAAGLGSNIGGSGGGTMMGSGGSGGGTNGFGAPGGYGGGGAGTGPTSGGGSGGNGIVIVTQLTP